MRQALGSFAARMSKEGSLLFDLGKLYESIPFEYLLIGHCLLVASWFPKLKDRYLLSYWVSLHPTLTECTSQRPCATSIQTLVQGAWHARNLRARTTPPHSSSYVGV